MKRVPGTVRVSRLDLVRRRAPHTSSDTRERHRPVLTECRHGNPRTGYAQRLESRQNGGSSSDFFSKMLWDHWKIDPRQQSFERRKGTIRIQEDRSTRLPRGAGRPQRRLRIRVVEQYRPSPLEQPTFERCGVDRDPVVALADHAALPSAPFDEYDRPPRPAAGHPLQCRQIDAFSAQGSKRCIRRVVVAHSAHEGAAQPEPCASQHRGRDLPAGRSALATRPLLVPGERHAFEFDRSVERALAQSDQVERSLAHIRDRTPAHDRKAINTARGTHADCEAPA